jgi:predicted Zn finger-like uncharacterized protein
MIATCPHCQSGFYIASDLAGKVVACSKCKKQVRAPERRGPGSPPPEEHNDGIPMARPAETRSEVEERLKSETETRFDTEKHLKEVLEAKTRAEEQSKIDAQARQEAEARLKIEVQARAAIEAKLLTEIEAKSKAEELALAAEQAKAELEARLKADIEARTKAEAQAQAAVQTSQEAETKLKGAVRASRELELKLRDEEVNKMKAETRADGEAESRTKMEQQLQAQTEAKTEAENQAKTESQTKRRMQKQIEEEIQARERIEQEAAAMKARLRDAEVATLIREPFNINKGLMRLTIVLSFVTAWLGGWFAYRNGYVIWSKYDRPVHLPWFNGPVYMPLVLIAFCVAGFVAAWAAYLLAIFIIKGFRQQPGSGRKKHQKQEPKIVTEEVVSADRFRPWRSS